MTLNPQWELSWERRNDTTIIILFREYEKQGGKGLF